MFSIEDLAEVLEASEAFFAGAAVAAAPDEVELDERRALAGLHLYVGDGASLVRPIVRYRDGTPIGHASIRDQLDRCARNRVPRAVFTHCGSAIVRSDPRVVEPRVEAMGRAVGVDARLAHDGMSLTLASRPRPRGPT